MLDFNWVDCISTGGGVYVALGQTSDGRYFVADDDYFSVTFVDEDPSVEDEFYGYVAADPDWQDVHMKDYMPDKKALKFWQDMLYWCIDNNELGDYDRYTINDRLDELTSN